MNDKCFEPGIIQAFLDGETSPELSFRLTSHTADCDKCALALAQAEEENSLVFAMLDREMNALVPTQRLWSSISVAIAQEKKRHSFWDRIRLGILATFASPSISVAASVVVVAGLLAAVWTLRSPVSTVEGPEIANSGPVQPAPQLPVVPTSVPSSVPDKDFGIVETNESPQSIRRLARNADFRPTEQRVRAVPAAIRTSGPAAEAYLPGEESYVRTIANLKEAVDGRKDTVMSPSVRISYERDMAVVNDSIKKMKQVVRRNPKNQAAKQVLYSSYQNKIDLLNSIVEREELMASMQ